MAITFGAMNGRGAVDPRVVEPQAQQGMSRERIETLLKGSHYGIGYLDDDIYDTSQQPPQPVGRIVELERNFCRVNFYRPNATEIARAAAINGFIEFCAEKNISPDGKTLAKVSMQDVEGLTSTRDHLSRLLQKIADAQTSVGGKK